jgi:hypothetical protein
MEVNNQRHTPAAYPWKIFGTNCNLEDVSCLIYLRLQNLFQQNAIGSLLSASVPSFLYLAAGQDQ